MMMMWLAVLTRWCELAYGHVAGRAGRLDVPQGLHEGGVHQDVAVADGEMLQGIGQKVRLPWPGGLTR